MGRPSEQLNLELGALHCAIRAAVILESQPNPSPEAVLELGRLLVSLGNDIRALGEGLIKPTDEEQRLKSQDARESDAQPAR